VLVGEAGLFGAEEEGYAGWSGFVCWSCGLLQLGEDAGGGLLEGEDGAMEVAFADGGGAGDEGAVGDGFGKGGEAAGLLHDGGCAYGGFGGLGVFDLGGLEGGGVVVDDAEVCEAEVLHGAGGGADVAGVAGAYEDDGEAGAICCGEHESIVCMELQRGLGARSG